MHSKNYETSSERRKTGNISGFKNSDAMQGPGVRAKLTSAGQALD